MPLHPEILVVDDDPGLRRSLQLFLRGHGYRVKAYSDVQSIIRDPEASRAVLLVVDYRLAGATGFEVLEMLRSAGFAGSAVLITGFGSKDLTERAEAFGFDLVLDKPVRPNQLLAISRAATRHP